MIGSDPSADEPDPQRIAIAVESCPAVARMHAGPAAAYLPGKRIPGISITTEAVTLHLDLQYPHAIAVLTNQVRTALEGLLAGRTLNLAIDDVVLPGSQEEPTASVTAADAASPPFMPTPGVQT